MSNVEVYILSGFLGSGKTTLLRNILKQEQEKNRKMAVVMNEVGSVSIDSDTVSDDIPLKELLNGCVCCTIQDQFEVQLHSLLQEYALDAIYIETTGVAHPVEVLDACLSPLFADKVDVRGIISLVDAKRWKDRQQLSPQLQVLLKEQIRHADVILINKIDDLSERDQASVSFEIQSLNPQALTILTTYAQVNLEDIQKLKLVTKEPHKQAQLQQQLRIQTYVHTFTRPVDMEKFEEWLRNLPDTIYRMKGYVRFNHLDGLYSFQYSYGMPIYMKEIMNVPTNLVIIGDALNKEQIKKELEQIEQ
ncbi:G3E family GTPase [Anoxybacillus calidus]|jgi:G3E family GTPase|uniref:G3E family GTPase n=1 Tax=[Anoxybacillus] calidus TaxID=575178 RepID=A0A7V9Z1P1_9BACL|nr:GTP-binding protein [Anoxybacillus calidus]MBA2872280.1 G3E family GTPase [Anoxybacillus calidus]